MTSNGKSRNGQSSPSYVRVREWLLSHVHEHSLGFGDKIPSERQIAGAVGLSRLTVAKAINELVKEGMLVQQTRSGTFIGGHLPKPPRSDNHTISVISTWCESISEPVVQPILHSIVQGASSVLTSAGYKLVVQYNHYANEEAEILSGLRDQNVSGAIIFPSYFPDNNRTFAKYASKSPPIVLVDHYFPDVPIDRVVTNNYAGTKEAVELLISRGHRRIAFLIECHSSVTSVLDREAGYRAALEEAGIPYDEDIVSGPRILSSGRISFDIVLEHLVRIPDPVTAVLGMNDGVIWMLLQAAGKLGLRVPGDLEVAGFFDAIIPPGVQTPFVRVVQPKFEIGQVAAKLLLDRVAGNLPPEPQHIEVPPVVVE